MSTRKIVAYEHTCQRCKHVWVSVSKQPKRCARQNCKSPFWMTDPQPVGKKARKVQTTE